jgi:hypothetical protein
MNRLQTRLQKLEKKIGVSDKNYLSRLSDKELEARLRYLYITQGIDPGLTLDEMIRISMENMKNESIILSR